MIHDRLDLDEWTKRFPLAEMVRDSDIASVITGPLPVAYLEQIRTEVKKSGGDLGEPVPLDLCVWKLGDSDRRDVTKIGGIPYWPAHEPWPIDDSDNFLTFVAQLCFADSKDILPKLPGDILSILAAGSDYQDIELRWLKIEHTPLVPVAKIPAAQWGIRPCHAVLHRTVEYPDADSELFEAYPYPLNIWARRLMDCSRFGGGWDIRGELPDPMDFEDVELRKKMERAWERVEQQKKAFFGQLASVQASVRHPFLNVEQYDEEWEENSDRFLMIADVGGFDLFHDGETTEFSWYSG